MSSVLARLARRPRTRAAAAAAVLALTPAILFADAGAHSTSAAVQDAAPGDERPGAARPADASPAAAGNASRPRSTRPRPGLEPRPVSSRVRVGPTRTSNGSPCAGLVALTFDDGPSPTETPRLLRVLTEENVPATFFVIGSRVAAHPEVVRATREAGFTVANHTWSHPVMTEISDRSVAIEIARTRKAIRQAGVQPVPLFRPPYGIADARVRSDIRRAGLKSVLWDVDSRDWAGGSSSAIAGRILSQLVPGRLNVVLQHDGVTNSPASVGAVRSVIERARERGFCFVALDGQGRVLRQAPPTRRPAARPEKKATQTGDRTSAARAANRPVEPTNGSLLQLSLISLPTATLPDFSAIAWTAKQVFPSNRR